MASQESAVLNSLATYDISHPKSDQQHQPSETSKPVSQESFVLSTPQSHEAKHLGSRLAGKVAIVTGGGSGFGEAICRRFAEEGAKVVVADMNAEGGERVAKGTHPDSMFFVKTNVGSDGDWEQLVRSTLDKFGRIDILVNNAGTSYRNKVCCVVHRIEEEADMVQPTLDVTEDEFDKVFNVNLKSIFHSVRHVVPNFIKQGDGGSIINVASIGATRPRPGLVWYNASKAAVTNVSLPSA